MTVPDRFDVRRADLPADWAAIVRLREQVYLHEQRRFTSAQQMADLFDRYNDYAVHLVGTVGARIVGTIRVTADSPLGLPCEAGADLGPLRATDRLAEVGHFVTDPQVRASGLGLALMRRAIDVAATDLQATQVLVDIFAEEDDAVRLKFHLAVGFQPVGEPYRDTRFPGSPRSIVAALDVAKARARRAAQAAGRPSRPPS